MILLRPTGLRGSGFSAESLQRALPALPPPLDAPGPLGPEEWEWLWANRKLARYAANRGLGYHTAARLGDADLVANAAPALARARLNYDPAGGAALHTWRTIWMRSYFQRQAGHLYACPGRVAPPDAARRTSSRRTPPLLLGSYVPEPPVVGEGRRGPDPEFAGAVMDAFAALDGRRRQALAMYLGLGGPGVTLEEIAGSLGVSKERARQLVASALAGLRKAVGVREPLRRRYTRLASKRTPEYRREYQRRHRVKRAAAPPGGPA